MYNFEGSLGISIGILEKWSNLEVPNHRVGRSWSWHCLWRHHLGHKSRQQGIHRYIEPSRIFPSSTSASITRFWPLEREQNHSRTKSMKGWGIAKPSWQTQQPEGCWVSSKWTAENDDSFRVFGNEESSNEWLSCSDRCDHKRWPRTTEDTFFRIPPMSLSSISHLKEATDNRVCKVNH